jgi:hypoxanthine phosphoribosyltransferase
LKEFVYPTWDQVEAYCFDMFSQMEKDGLKPDSIVALLRGGVVPARIFSDFYGILLNFFALDVKFYTGIGETQKAPVIRAFNEDITGETILIVDDIWDSGKTMQVVLDHFGDTNIVTSTLFWKETAKGKPDYYSQVAKENEWIVFPWEKREMSNLK